MQQQTSLLDIRKADDDNSHSNTILAIEQLKAEIQSGESAAQLTATIGNELNQFHADWQRDALEHFKRRSHPSGGTMNEIRNVIRDIRSGALPAAESAGYLRYLAGLVCGELGKISLAIVFGFALAWLLVG